ncbi:MAG TPA: hypothetical protein VMW65_03725 [Chloroflexota bacterium]|nr:hypothetical protein [Chloroflexota bacterium]
MSYLDPLRLHFAGKFQAAVSTINNDTLHYNNATFRPEYWERGEGATKGWWNPRGSADWRLIGSQVTAAWLADGRQTGTDDLILRCSIADSDRRVPAKLVDLDPDQQLVSQIWGLEVRICDSNGHTLVRGQFEPAPFMDIWGRTSSNGGDMGASSLYQSVLTGLEWGDLGQSVFLQQLQSATRAGLLSIKFNVDGYCMDFRSPDFTLGRIVGTIGPFLPGEPRHLLRGRQFMPTNANTDGGFFEPSGKINFCTAVVNLNTRKIYLDLGNALPTSVPGGPPTDIGTLSLVCQVAATDSSGSVENLPLGDLLASVYTAPAWYPATAGIVEFPIERELTDAELRAVGANPLAILLPDSNGQTVTAISESPAGEFVCADQAVFRLNPGEHADVLLYATRFGQPYPEARVISILDNGQLGGPGPAVGEPIDGLDFPARVTTDAEGRAVLRITARDPGNPRVYVDGQVYGVRPMLEDTLPVGENYPFNPADFVSLLIWSGWTPDEPPTWYGSIQPVFQQYSNLYPVMQRILDMSDYESVCAHRQLLVLAFSLEERDPNAMPVTRDLSAAKRRAILRWLNEGATGKPLGPDEKPLLGVPRTVPAPTPTVFAAPPAIAPPAGKPEGGKAAALRRRLVVQRSRRTEGGNR